jgi:hypothetical protein
LRAFVATCSVVSVAAACTARDSLLDEVGASGGGPAAGSGSAQGGSAQPSGGGPEPKGGTSSLGGSGSGGSALASGGSALASGGTAGGPDGTPECPDGQRWCPGCTVGTGLCAVGCPGAACQPCADVTMQEECDARVGCHSVFLDAGVCACPTAGCCMAFARCADGDNVDCTGKGVNCEALTPACGPAFVNSYTPSCYEGCVDRKDCAAPACPEAPADGCSCYADSDCSSGQRCYSADCANDRPGTCRVPPPKGCFGDADCPPGQTCIGGQPAPCDTTIVDRVGTCGVEACPEGDCPGTAGPTCSCSDGGQCVSATGATGSGQCRGPDGVCSACKCASPDTPIATPHGERRIADLRAGELVYSVDGDQIRAVPILRVNRTPVVGHQVLHVTFENGRFIEMTAGHPLADGRPLSALGPGSQLMGSAVVSITRVAYTHSATHDILPDSTSGAYFASGVLIGSTLAGSRGSCSAQATVW